MATHFCDQDLNNLDNNVPETFNDWFAARNICDDKVLANLMKFSRTRIKVGLQYWLKFITLTFQDIFIILKPVYRHEHKNENPTLSRCMTVSPKES